jgi:hypothetical protein
MGTNGAKPATTSRTVSIREKARAPRSEDRRAVGEDMADIGHELGRPGGSVMGMTGISSESCIARSALKGMLVSVRGAGGSHTRRPRATGQG